MVLDVVPTLYRANLRLFKSRLSPRIIRAGCHNSRPPEPPCRGEPGQVATLMLVGGNRSVVGMMAQAWTVAENMRPLSGSQPQSFHHEQGAHAAKTGTARVGRNGQAEKPHDASFFPSQWKAAVPVIGVNALVEDPSGQLRPPRLGARALGSPAKVHNTPLSQACERGSTVDCPVLPANNGCHFCRRRRRRLRHAQPLLDRRPGHDPTGRRVRTG
jgi:hypothetical protein